MKKYFFIKLVVVNVLLIAAYMICNYTQYFIPQVTYAEDEVRVVIDNKEVTKNLPNPAILENGNVFLSFKTVQKYFDRYVYLDQKYGTVIITNDQNIMKLKLGESKLIKNGEERKIQYPATTSGDIVYLPLKEIEEMFQIQSVVNDKIIITTQKEPYRIVKASQKGNVKMYRKAIAGTVDSYLENEELYVYATDEIGEFVKVRTARGNLGYVKKEVIDQGKTILQFAPLEVVGDSRRKIHLTWEYAENFTPDRSSEAKIDGLNTISPTWLYMKDETGELKNTINESYIDWAKNRGYALWPTVKNDTMGLDKTSELVTDMHAREKFMTEVLKVAEKYHFEGINIDFENMKQEDREEFSQFVREFSAMLRNHGILVSIDVTVPDGSPTWSLCYDRTAIGAAVDYVILMAYDQYGRNQDGPVASLKWVEANIGKMLEQEKIPKEKLILGVPFYSKRLKYQESMSGEEVIKENPNGSTLYMRGAKNHLSANQSSATWDELMGQYVVEIRNGNRVDKAWIEDEKALELKVKLVDEYELAGVATWRWGFETSDAWKIIKENVSGL